MQFVREHQPDLAKLFEFMQKKRPKDFQTAILEVERVRTRLENVKKRDGQLYDIELAIWQNNARLRLLVAELSSAKRSLTDEDRARVRELVEEEQELVLKRLEHERTAAEARAKQLAEQIDKRRDGREGLISKGMKQWENRIQRGDKKNKPEKSGTNEESTKP